MCKYSKMLLGIRYNERENNKIVTLGPHKVYVKSVVARVRNGGSLFQSNVCNFRRGYSLLSVLARCPQGGS